MKIISQAPARISLFGGSTDVPPYVDLYGGIIISFAINIYSQVQLYSGDDMWGKTSHEMPFNADPKLFYSILQHFGINGMHHVRVSSQFDGIIGAGLASSGSATTAILGAIYKLNGFPVINKLILANQGWELERQFHHTGQQDHYAAVFGGMNIFTFKDKNVTQTALSKNVAEALQKRIVLCYIGGERKDKNGQKVLTHLSNKQVSYLNAMQETATIAYGEIQQERWEQVGKLLGETWQQKKQINPQVTSKRIDKIYDYAIDNGAIGGKLCGSGQGGYMIFLVDPYEQDNFTMKMQQKGMSLIDYSIDWNGLMVRAL